MWFVQPSWALLRQVRTTRYGSTDILRWTVLLVDRLVRRVWEQDFPTNISYKAFLHSRSAHRCRTNACSKLGMLRRRPVQGFRTCADFTEQCDRVGLLYMVLNVSQAYNLEYFKPLYFGPNAENGSGSSFSRKHNKTTEEHKAANKICSFRQDNKL